MIKVTFAIEKTSEYNNYHIHRENENGGMYVPEWSIGAEVDRLIEIYNKEYGAGNFELTFKFKG